MVVVAYIYFFIIIPYIYVRSYILKTAHQIMHYARLYILKLDVNEQNLCKTIYMSEC